MPHALALALALASPADAVEPALDHAAWQAVLDAHVDAAGRVDYAAIRASGAVEPYLQALAGAAEPTATADRVAFWINAYNALTVDLIADSWPLASIRDLDGGAVWTTRRFTVAGQPVTLDEIEHQRIRPLADGRIHAAVNCASVGCPPLPATAFTGADLEAQLDAAATRWVATNAVVLDRSAGTARFSRIFDWYGEDFAVAGDPSPPGLDGELAEAAAWVAARADAGTAAWLRAGGYRADWAEYDWSVNAQ